MCDKSVHLSLKTLLTRDNKWISASVLILTCTVFVIFQNHALPKVLQSFDVLFCITFIVKMAELLSHGTP